MRMLSYASKESRLGFIVKRIKGRLYVYEYAKIDGKAVEVYIGSLEEIVRAYQAMSITKEKKL